MNIHHLCKAAASVVLLLVVSTGAALAQIQVAPKPQPAPAPSPKPEVAQPPQVEARPQPTFKRTCTIANSKEFLDRCPTNDPAYARIMRDLKIRKDGQLVNSFPCTEPVSQMSDSAMSSELVTLQSLRFLYYVDMGRSGHVPWTPGTLYAWLTSNIAGIHIDSTADLNHCCDFFPEGRYIVVKPISAATPKLAKDLRGIAMSAGLLMHETRHVDPGQAGHVRCCPAQDPQIADNACDQRYDPADPGPYGVQYWMETSLLSGYLYTGYQCLDATSVRDTYSWFWGEADRRRARFCEGAPPELTDANSPVPACEPDCARPAVMPPLKIGK